MLRNMVLLKLKHFSGDIPYCCWVTPCVEPHTRNIQNFVQGSFTHVSLLSARDMWSRLGDEDQNMEEIINPPSSFSLPDMDTERV